ncbi:MAG TPA: bifunctional hydroxymethylpyrimidine kinase/phosphomethylpyrimidine kinase [Acidisarcina sp.]
MPLASEVHADPAGNPVSGPARRATVLTIAGFDPSSGAGITADLKVFAAHRLYGMACITALTVQSTAEVARVRAVEAEVIRETLSLLAEDVLFSGIKIGMLGTAAAVLAVSDFLRVAPAVVPKSRIVLDPVLRSSSGRELLEPIAVDALKRELLALIGWITPNLDELSTLTGFRVAGREDVPRAAAELKEIARKAGNESLAVLSTGGHLASPDDYLLDPDGRGSWLPGVRVETRSTHGTGCALSSALLCRLVMEDAPIEAAANAKAYVAAALQAAYPVGRGRGPMNHLFNLE